MTNESKFFYASGCELALSAYDLTLKFVRKGVIKPPDAKVGALMVLTDAQTMDEMSIGMSPSHAKAIIPALYKAILDYEKQFGEIPLPPDAKAMWTATFSSVAEPKNT